MSKVVSVSLSNLQSRFDSENGRVLYKLGAKAPSLGCPASLIRLIDCSGFVRDALFFATGGKLILPEGSQPQRDWCEENGLYRLKHYSDVEYAREDDSRLFIAFLSPHPGSEWPRHVWLIHQARTMESCGSHGVCSRDWDNSNLIHAAACYELPAAA